MARKKIKIQDEPDLVKDGGVVVNVNQEAFLAYHTQRKLAQDKDEKLQSLEDKIAQLESIVNQLLESKDQK